MHDDVALIRRHERVTPRTLEQRTQGRRVEPSGIDDPDVLLWLSSMTFRQFCDTPFPEWMASAHRLDCILYLRGVQLGALLPMFNKNGKHG